jgi:hypothetical protein
MNDELDTLRSFRPEATGPTDALQLQERTALMETIATAPSGAPHRMPRLTRRRGVVLGIAVALVAAAGAAGATGVIPVDVQQELGFAASQSPDSALTPLVDQAVQRASAPTADGGTLQLWTAPTDGGGTCAYLRHLDASGSPTDSGPISCAVSLPGGAQLRTGIQRASVAGNAGSATSGHSFGSSSFDSSSSGSGGNTQVEVDSTGAATVFGQAPDSVANVEVVDASGTVLGQAAVQDGWYLVTLSASTASSAASLVEQSASGATVSTQPLHAAPPPAPGPGTVSGG